MLGADDGGEANLTYTWTVTAKPAGAANPTYSANGTNAAKNTTATFSQAGSYTFLVTIADTGGLTDTSSVAVTVTQTLTTITDSPSSASLNLNGTQSFSAIGYDQFGAALAVQPSFTWATASGVGSINASGLYTAGSVAGLGHDHGDQRGGGRQCGGHGDQRRADGGHARRGRPEPVTGTSTALSVLGADDGGEANLTYTWTVTAEARRRGQPDLQRQRHERRQEHHRHILPGRQLHLPGDHRRHRWFDRHQQCRRHRQSDPDHDHRFTVVGEPEPQWHPVVLRDRATTSSVRRSTVQPSFTWAMASGVGSINASGLYTAGSVAGSATITATSGAVVGSAAVTVTNAAPTVATPAAAAPNARSLVLPRP